MTDVPAKRLLLLTNNDRLALKAADAAAQDGWSVEAAGRRDLPALRRSRRVGRVHVLPDGQAADFAALARRLGTGLVFPVDVWAFGMAHEMAAIAPDLGIVPALSAAALREIDDKIAFVALAAAAGVAVPRSGVIAEGDDPGPVLQAIGAPLVLKTPFGESGRGVFPAATIAEALMILGGPLAARRPVQVQSHVAGPVLGLNVLAKDGVVAAASAYRKLSADRFRFAPDPALEAAIAPLLKATRFSGLANFDAIETPAGPVFLECNPRVWYNLQADALTGLNYVAAAARLVRGEAGRDPHSCAGEWTMPQHLLKRAAALDAAAFRAGGASWRGAWRALSDPLAHMAG